MTLDQCIALFSAGVSFTGLVFVGLQLRSGTKQRTSDSLVKILDTNRELITLGFSHPELFAILAGGTEADPIWIQRYLQLWLNQFSLVHSYIQNAILPREAKENLERDISEFMATPNMRKHWRAFGHLYPVSFQTYIKDVLKKDEPPKEAAHHAAKKHGHHDAKT